MGKWTASVVRSLTAVHVVSEDVWGCGGVTPYIIHLCQQSAAGSWAITLREQLVVPVGEDWWNPQQVCNLMEKRRLTLPNGNRNRVVRPVTSHVHFLSYIRNSYRCQCRSISQLRCTESWRKAPYILYFNVITAAL